MFVIPRVEVKKELSANIIIIVFVCVEVSKGEEERLLNIRVTHFFPKKKLYSILHISS